MASVDFSNFTFTAEQIRDIKQLLFDEVLHAPALEEIHTLYNGIVYDREIGFITGGGLVGKAKQGCNPDPQDWSIGTRVVTWQPKAWQVLLRECANDLEDTLAVYCKKNGVAMDDLTGTDYMAVVSQVLGDSIKDMFYRFVWFGDTDAANVTDTGVITDGVDTEYFTLIDGLFKQLEAAVAEDSTLLVDIEANDEASKSAQLSAMTADAAYEILSNMYYAAPIEMRASGNMRFLVTQTIADGYQKYLTDKGLESTYTNLVEGIRTLTFLGVPVVVLPIWDKMIHAYNDLGDTYYKPHRAVLIEKENLAVGTPSNGAIDTVDIYYDRVSKYNYLEAADRIDAKLLNPSRLVYAE